MLRSCLLAATTLITSGLAFANTITTTINFTGSFTPANAKVIANELNHSLDPKFRELMYKKDAKISYTHDPNHLQFTLIFPAPAPASGPQIWLGRSSKGNMRLTCACWDDTAKRGKGDNVCHYNQGARCGNRKDLFQTTSPMTIQCTTANQRGCYTSHISVDTAHGTMTIQSEGGRTTTIKCLRDTKGYNLYGNPSTATKDLYWLGADNQSGSLVPIQCNIPTKGD